MKRYALLFVLGLSVALGLGCSASSFTETIFATSTPSQTPTPVYTATPTLPPTPTPTPTLPPAQRIHQADRSVFLGDYQQAQKEYQAALKTANDPETQAAGLLGTAYTFYLMGNCTTANQGLTSLIERFPSSPQRANAYFFMAKCYESLNNPAKAAEMYNSYLQLRPGLLDPYINELRGDALAAAADHAGAIAAYQTALESKPMGDTTELNIKIGKAYNAQADYNAAVRTFMEIYNTTQNPLVKAQMNLLAGNAYLALGLQEQAFARFNDSVSNYPRTYDAYSGLVVLVNSSVPVDPVERGIVDYYAGKYGLAIDIFNVAIKKGDHTGAPHHFKALALREQKQYEAAIKEWDNLIKDHPGDKYWAPAWDEKAYTQWAYLDKFEPGAKTLLEFVGRAPDSESAPQFLFDAGYIMERDNKLPQAAAIWEQLFDQYPANDLAYRGLFLAGLAYYRQGDYEKALTTFQRGLALGGSTEEQAAGYLWVGKTQKASGNEQAAKTAWETAVLRDPGGYYSVRANELLNGAQPFTPVSDLDLGYDLSKERPDAEAWLRKTFNIAADVNLDDLGPLASDVRLQRGEALWQLGLYEDSRNQYEALRQSLEQDALNSYRLLDHLLEKGFYRLAIVTSRQILTLAGMDDAATLKAPLYFNHIRFGPYYREQVLEAARDQKLDPIFVFSVIRQESMFEGFIHSSAGARGLMQLMPGTGKESADMLRWPPDYKEDDLYRPVVNIPLGASYLRRQMAYMGDPYGALAAYNAGPGNAKIWQSISADDPDLFLEIIRFQETRRYIRQIAENAAIYKQLYQRKQ
jgi:soluble lytic murein transglycosylase